MDPRLHASALASTRGAAQRNARLVVAWAVAVLVVAAIFSPWGFGVLWPDLRYEVKGAVVAVSPASGGEYVSFSAAGDGVAVHWERFLDADHSWERGDPIDGWVSDDRRFFQDEFGRSWLSGPGFFFWPASAVILLFVLRRWIGILVASWDLSRGDDRPRRAFVGLAENPIPRMWRPLIHIWWDEPRNNRGKGPTADLCLIADDDTGRHLISDLSLQVHPAWVDTGRWKWSKPRWVALDDGTVLIPHRRATIAAIFGPGAVRKGKPSVEEEEASVVRSKPRADTSLLQLILPRLACLVAIAVVADLVAGGDPVTLAHIR